MASLVMRKKAKTESYRIKVEHWFGKLKGLWKILANKYNKSLDNCAVIWEFCAALTNYHINFHPLSITDYIFDPDDDDDPALKSLCSVSKYFFNDFCCVCVFVFGVLRIHNYFCFE